MSKTVKSVICILLLFALVSAFVLPVLAEEPETPEVRELHIRNVEEFLEFAENCRLDAYSQDLTVYLEADLDLAGTEFEGVPIFFGTFDGGSHEITGLNLTREGSVTGLFRYVAESAVIQDLTVKGNVLPQGSMVSIGGVAGDNAGTIRYVRFEGEVTGRDGIGGIAGTNRVTGVIEHCVTRGNVHGDHFVGGVAGENRGVIRDCRNVATVNTSSKENTVDITSITLDTIAGTESANTVTDVGGIAGASLGVVRDCVNLGNVGYPHMGYNIGGIAGSQKGFVGGCTNRGEIFARKEGGGIVGQLEPISKIEYSVDTLQILKGQLQSTSYLVNQASANTMNNVGAINSDIASMKEQSEIAKDALDVLLPGGEEPFPPDPDSILAAHNALTGSMHTMKDLMGSITGNAQGAASQLSSDMQAISGSVRSMSQTLSDAENHIGGTVTDISDLDTDEEMSGEIAHCRNFGRVSADLNAGGIVGSMAFENDFDPEDDLQFIGDQSLNFDSQIRAVVVDCENSATISAKKSCAGGIVGWVSVGLVKDCLNTGHLDADSAQYVGGIAGSSSGYLRSCSTKCQMVGSSYVGGIAGSGTVVTDCFSMVNIVEADEKFGAVLGYAQAPKDETVTEPIANNLYVRFTEDPGAIDGVSYQGAAEPRDVEQLELPDTFREASVTFLYEDGSETLVTLPIGQPLTRDQIPAVPEKEGCSGQWRHLEDVDLSHMYFDMRFETEYIPHRMTIGSLQKGPDGRPVLMAEGRFPEVDHIDTAPLDALPTPSKGTTLDGWTLPEFDASETVLHYACPEGSKPELLTVLLRSADGSWREVPADLNGSYLVFTAAEGDDAMVVVELPDYSWIPYAVGAVVIAALLITVSVVKKKKKK